MDTPTAEQTKTKQPYQAPQTERLADDPHLTEEEIEEIFRRAIAEIPPHLLVPQKTRQERRAERQVAIMLLIGVLSYIIGSAIAIVTYPTVTVVITPVSKSVTVTARLNIPTRDLVPVTLSKTASIPTTGTGHQPATRAGGTLTFYNGSFSSQTIPAGSVFSAADGVQISTDAAITIPANNPPQDGIGSVAASAIRPGSKGNIAPLEIDVRVSSDLLAKNLTPFSGGKDARTFRAVAQKDLGRLTTSVKAALAQQMPQAFSLRAGEALMITRCTFTASSNHNAGDAAVTVSEKATEMCKAVAYHQDDLQQRATATFTNATKPGTGFQLIGSVQATVTSVSPVTAQMRGLWVYALSQGYEGYLAQQIAGDTPNQARAYLLKTGFITQAAIPQTLPKDPYHIHFLQVIGN
jgi:hypothetical protein